MKQLVFNYAPVRFLPYLEVGEFVNVGVVIHSPQTGLFDYRLVRFKRTARVKGFFPELDTKIFKAGLQGIERELGWRKIQAGQDLLPGQVELEPKMAQNQLKWFTELVRKREGLLHFGEPGTLLANAAEDALEQLFGRYVERQFAQKREYQEIVMRNRLAAFLRDWKLDSLYERNQKVGDDEFHVVMPFVHFFGEIAGKAIKPLDLNKAESTDIYQHGGTWVKNMERLKNRDQLPLAVVFTVQLPQEGKPLRAANEICDELRQLGIEPVEFGNVQSVRRAVGIETAA